MKKIEIIIGKREIKRKKGESGVTLVIALMIMVVLTLMGLAALMTSSVDLRVTGNDRVQKQAFYAADAGLNYGKSNPEGKTELMLTSIDRTNPGPFIFSNPNGSATTYAGNITWTRLTNPPAGSGTGTRGGFKAHHYLVDCTGYGENQAQKRLQMQGYRIGF